jgi:hypothetical protein
VEEEVTVILAPMLVERMEMPLVVGQEIMLREEQVALMAMTEEIALRLPVEVAVEAVQVRPVAPSQATLRQTELEAMGPQAL